MTSVNINTLPVENIELTEKERSFLNTIINSSNHNTWTILKKSLKHALLAGILFVILSLPFIINIIHRTVNFTSQTFIIELSARTIIFILLFWLIDETFLRND